MMPVRAALDLLTPGLRYETAGCRGNTVTQLSANSTGGIDITINGKSQELLSAADLADGTYKTAFRPRVKAALEPHRD